MTQEQVLLDEIVITDRVRRLVDGIDELSSSIRNYGLIQPLVLVQEQDPIEPIFHPRLVAGGRRYNALRRLGVKELIHGKHFIWREEIQPAGDSVISLKMKGIELEENLRRKELTWQEQVEGKARLLEIMQSIYGPPKDGRLPRNERVGRDSLEVNQGFGVNKLAAMLGESAANTSRDLKIAAVAKQAPEIMKQQSKGSAMRLLDTVAKVKGMITKAVTQRNTYGEWKLYEGDFKDNIHQIQNGSVDLVYCDLPFGVALSEMSKHDTGAIGYNDSRDQILSDLDFVAGEAYRILAQDRFAVFWFGFNYYSDLINALSIAGFNVNLVPFVWYKNTRSTENPNARYANAYDPAIIAMKGSPMFIKPGMQNYAAIPAVIGKLQQAQQPVELVERFLGDMTLPGATVVDLTAGSGTTGVASSKNNRKVIMFERETAACVIIKARMGAMQ